MAKTIFILGAGASSPYGFPLGEKLVIDILKNTEHTPSPDSLYHILRPSFGIKDINYFRNKLAASRVNSIDSFLYRNPQFLELGKACIAYIILKYEDESMKSNYDDDWYKYFWNELNSRLPEEFDFKMYTFNYDRSLEFYLENACNNLFPEKDYAKNYFEKISITHLHGSLGSWNYGGIDKFGNYGQLSLIAEKIKIIFEVEEDSNFEQLYQDLASANHIIFLGFGFHEDNMKRMKILDINYINMPNFYASMYNLGTAQIDSKFARYIKSIHFKMNRSNNGFNDYLKHSLDKNLKFLQNRFPMHYLFK